MIETYSDESSMHYELGVIMAVIAMISWGFGDFLIQKFARIIGDWESLFYISIFGVIVIFPFIYNQLPALAANLNAFLILLIASVVLLLAALLDFEALKEGKIAIAEPIFVLEIPVASVLAFVLIGEGIGIYQILLICGLIVGLVLVSLRKWHFKGKKWLEKGVILAGIGSLFMGVANFAFGIGARVTSALMINWFTSLFLAIACIIYLGLNFRAHKLIRIKDGRWLLMGMCVLDNVAWISFAYAMVFAPIAIAVSISQCFIIVTVLLGIFISHERLKDHQKLGIAIAIVFGIALAIITG